MTARPAPAVVDSSFERLVGALGTGSLGDIVLREARAIAGVDEIFGFRLDDDGADPVPLASAGCRGSARKRASRYSSSFHHMDPMLERLRATANGAAQSGAIAARDIDNDRYRSECFERPGLQAKVAFVRRGAGGLFLLNFYCTNDRLLPQLTAKLSALAAFALPILARHSDLVAPVIGLPLQERVRRRLLRAHPELTAREADVCCRTIIGMSAEAIALSLGIGQATVLTYRRRAYERCKVSSAAQFLGDVIEV